MYIAFELLIYSFLDPQGREYMLYSYPVFYIFIEKF